MKLNEIWAKKNINEKKKKMISSIVVSRANKFDSRWKKNFGRFLDDKILQIGIDLFPIWYSLFNNGSM